MLSQQVKRRRGRSRADVGSYWLSFSDMLSSLLLVFVLALVFSIYQYYSQLAIKTQELQQQQQVLDQAQIVLAAQKKELETTRVTLMGKEEQLAAVQIQLDKQQADLKAAQAALKTKEDEQAILQLQLSTQEQTLANQEIRLSAMQDALSAQQRQIDDLLGVRTAIIRDLSRALNEARLNAKVDPATGDIILDSKLMFEFGRHEIAESGKAQLYQMIPVYLGVLMRPEYASYVAEIIIEGHTDSSGDYINNLKLSQNRALEVATFCLEMSSLNIQQRQLLKQIMTAKGRSFSDLIRNADGSENMDASRRVEIKFRLKDSEMIQKMNEILSGMPAL